MISTEHLKSEDGNLRTDKCGGAIVSRHIVVTAAHCMVDIIALKVLFGALYLEVPWYERYVPIENVRIHPHFNKPSGAHDVSTIYFKKRIRFGPFVGMIDIIDHNFPLRTGSVVVMFGYTRGDKERKCHQSSLSYIYSDVYNFSSCKSLYSWKDLNSNREFCVRLWNGTHCTNKGDSGGLFVFRFLFQL